MSADPGFPTVTVVVPARNEAASIEACVTALARQAYPAELVEIVVADGMSTDGTREILARLHAANPRVRLVDNPRRITPEAMNAGVRAATGDLITLMSAHGAAANDYLARAVEALRETGAWAVGGRIQRVAATPIQRAIARITSSPIGVGNASHNYATEGQWVETAFPGMWPRWVFERVGMFDPELVRNQDDELSFRIREAGGKIWYDPRIVVAYEPRGSLPGLFSQYRQYGFWKIRVMQKHPAALRWRHFVPAAWVGGLVAGPVLGLVVHPLLLAAWGAVVALYGVAVAAATRRMVAPGLRWRDLAAVTAVLHAAYGAGFWQGLIVLAPRWVRDRKGRAPRLAPRAAEPDAPASPEAGPASASSASASPEASAVPGGPGAAGGYGV